MRTPAEDGPPTYNVQLTQPIIGHLAAAGASTVLDLGCGSGWFSQVLWRCGFEVTGVDRSDSRLQTARSRYPDLRLQQHDIVEEPDASWIGRFDAVVAIDVIDHLTRPRLLIETALATLKPGGLLIVTSPFHGYAKNLALALTGRFDRRWEALSDSGRVKFFSRATLGTLMLESGLSQVQVRTVGRITPFARALLASGRAPA
jgi:2-polyprenyl-6-hydroxyphenyl methylase/3-demethylubiquinone-9 3-methyltransferase